MKKKRLLLMILPAIVVGALVFTLYNQSTGTTRIVAAKDTINAGTVIKEDMLTMMEVPNTAVPNGALTNKENVIGKSVLYTRSPGDIIFRDTLTDVEDPVLNEGEAFVAIELPNAISDMVSEGTQLTVIKHLLETEISGTVDASVTFEEETAEASASVKAKADIKSVDNLPVYSIVQAEGEISAIKYAIVKTDLETAKKLVNITAGEHSVVITR